MKPLQRKLLEQLIDGLAEPVLVARIDSADWPVVMHNPAFSLLADDENLRGRPFADVIEHLLGRELALEVGEALRQEDETSFAVELARREYLLVLKPLSLPNNPGAKYYAAYWRSGPAGMDDLPSSAPGRRSARQLLHGLRTASRPDLRQRN